MTAPGVTGAPPTRTLPDSVIASARPATLVPTVPRKSSGEVKLLGVCSYTESAVTCWKPDGERSKDLEPTVDGLLRTNSGYQSRMRYGYKNRIIVFSRPSGPSSVNYRNPDAGENGYLEMQSTNESFGPKIDAVFVATTPGVESGSILAKVQHHDVRPAVGDLPLKAGAQMTVDGIKVRIVKIAPMATSAPYYNAGFEAARDRPRWKVEMTADRAANPESYSGFQLVGTNGRSIEVLDEKGKPIERTGYTMGQRTMPAMMPIGSSRSGGSDLVLMVNPTLVKRLRFTVTRPELGQFRDIPLDPKR
ncbi:hypothetical protein EON77_12790 [bacterium]|nr:MAG: hypothetical protein EON77_12790 [bacterium]